MAWSEKQPAPLFSGNLPWGNHEPEKEQPPIDDWLDPRQQHQVCLLLAQHISLFYTRPGRTDQVQHEINTAAGQVCWCPLQPLPCSQWDVADHEVQEMLQLGVIESSTSAWRSPIILVPKPDRSIRFREVNKVATFNAYLMPQADILLSQLGEASYIRALDLTKRYWQVPLQTTDKEKTAFATRKGPFQFTMMPFGLHGAAATFQRLMDTILRPCKGFTLAYLDDIAEPGQNT